MNILLINCACSLINMFIIFYISKMLFKKENIQKILIIFLAVFALYWMFFNAHFYGNIIGLTFALIAVLFTLFYLEKNNWINLLFAGIFIGIAILLKNNYQIFLCGIIVVIILNIIKNWNLKILLIVPIFMIGYFSVNLTYSAILKYNDVNLPEGVPMISFVYMGMDEPKNLSPGWYNGITIKLYGDSGFDQEKTSEITKELIGERLKYFLQNPKEFVNYYAQKIGSTWLNPTFQTVWYSLPGIRCIFDAEYTEYITAHPTMLNMVAGKYLVIEENIFNIYQIIIFIFASIGIFKLAKNINLQTAFLLIIFAGGFVFHIIWETKAIYVIQYYFMLLPFAAYGLDYIIDSIENFIKERKINKNA